MEYVINMGGGVEKNVCINFKNVNVLLETITVNDEINILLLLKM